MRGPKEKKERSLGERLHLKGERCQSPKCALVRKPYKPGVHGQKRSRALSDFGKQIKEKQKFKISYGVNEKNMLRIFKSASKKSGSVGMKILELLERRLDNAVFLSGFALSRSAARQLVVHGHIAVNGKKVRSPGMEIKVNDVVSVRDSSRENAVFKKIQDVLKKYEAPSWLLLDKDKMEAKILEIPHDFNQPFEINSLVESFSK